MPNNEQREISVSQYETSHQHPANRACHVVGIPMIAVSIPIAILSIAVNGLWPVALALFLGGWVLQFIGHWFEGKPPEFFHDWRFLLVGLKWWGLKVRGRV
jgi:uncharacterized membrane protein YGL010W